MFGIKTWIKRAIKNSLQSYRNKHKTIYKKKCACCGNRFREYLRISNYYSEQVKKYGRISNGKSEMLNKEEYLCPCCGASDRDRAYAVYMKKALDRDKDYNILDFAPASGLSDFIRRRFPKSNYKTADISGNGVDFALDIMYMGGLKDDCIDFFICSHVLEHVRDDIQAMKELRRILKKGGKGICVVPIDLECSEIDEDPDCIDVGERWRRFGQNDHVRKYSKKGFIDRLRSVGFDVLEYNNKYFTKKEMFENGLMTTSTLYIVS